MKIQDLMGRLVPMKELTAKKQAVLAQSAEVLRFSKGGLIFDFGDTSPYSYYLVRGELNLTTPDGAQLRVRAVDAQATYPIGNLLPRKMRAEVGSQSAELLKISRDDIEREMAQQGFASTDSGLPVQELQKLPPDQQKWTLALLSTPLFSLLPLPDLHAVLKEFKGITYEKGQEVVREGEPAGYFYLLLSGSCAVIREGPNGPIEINRIHAPDGFGEEAVITGEPRGATITMLSDGVLSRVEHAVFTDHILTPLIRHTPMDTGLRLAAEAKAQIIDVRDDDAYVKGELPRALHVPMYMLYLKSRALNPKIPYLVYGEDDKRSQSATFLLARRGLKASILGSKGRAVDLSLEQAMILPGASG